MISSTHGIILRTRPLTETSLIVNWLTPHLGRVATVAKGARRPKSPFIGKLDLFYAADFSFTRSRTSELHNLREVKLQETHGAIREDIVKLQQAAYAAAFLELATETESPMPEIFELVRSFLALLCQQPPLPQNIFALELKLLHQLGLEPDLEETRLAPGTKKIAQSLLENDWATGSRLKLSDAQTTELRQWLNVFFDDAPRPYSAWSQQCASPLSGVMPQRMNTDHARSLLQRPTTIGVGVGVSCMVNVEGPKNAGAVT